MSLRMHPRCPPGRRPARSMVPGLMKISRLPDSPWTLDSVLRDLSRVLPRPLCPWIRHHEMRTAQSKLANAKAKQALLEEFRKTGGKVTETVEKQAQAELHNRTDRTLRRDFNQYYRYYSSTNTPKDSSRLTMPSNEYFPLDPKLKSGARLPWATLAPVFGKPQGGLRLGLVAHKQSNSLSPGRLGSVRFLH